MKKVPKNRTKGGMNCQCGERIVEESAGVWRHTGQRTVYADPYYCVSPGRLAKPEVKN